MPDANAVITLVVNSVFFIFCLFRVSAAMKSRPSTERLDYLIRIVMPRGALTTFIMK